MLGSGEKATQLLADLSAFASKTPFELTGIRQNAKQLLAMGIASDDLIPTMKALGDVSAGLSVPLDRLALAYGQVIAKGKLQGGELKQFTEAGVPLIATMSKTLGVTQGEFYKMVEAGKISADEVVKAFQTMSGEGGQFNNLMIQQSQTMSGMWSNFKDQLALTGEAIGTALMPAMK
jgi:tape measure domain-containing protein